MKVPKIPPKNDVIIYEQPLSIDTINCINIFLGGQLQLHLMAIVEWANVEMVPGTIMKKAVCIRDWRRAKLKEGEFWGEHDRENSPAVQDLQTSSSRYILSQILNNKSTARLANSQRLVSSSG